jgi:thymidylate synthase ThyX
MNLRSFANYQKLRNSEHAQPEIKTVAQLMLAEVEDKNMCPVAIHTLKEKHWEL